MPHFLSPHEYKIAHPECPEHMIPSDRAQNPARPKSTRKLRKHPQRPPILWTRVASILVAVKGPIGRLSCLYPGGYIVICLMQFGDEEWSVYAGDFDDGAMRRMCASPQEAKDLYHLLAEAAPLGDGDLEGMGFVFE